MKTKEAGDPSVLYIGEAPKPSPKPHELLVRIRATALNRADTLQRRGLYPPPAGESEVLGLEAAGVVEALGSDCSRYRVGDRVFMLMGGGGYAEYATVPEGMAMPIPNNLSFEEAAAIAEVYLTAWQALHWIAKIQPGERVLIHAAASGVGTAAIQLARQMNCHVFGTASTAEKLAKCTELGLDLGINYKTEDFADRIQQQTDGRGVDVIVDFVAASYYAQNLKSIALDGRWVVLALLGGAKLDGFRFSTLLRKRIQLTGSTLRSRSLDYKMRLTQDFVQQALPLFESGKLKPVIDSIMDWADAAKAHERMERNENVGKIVLRINS